MKHHTDQLNLDAHARLRVVSPPVVHKTPAIRDGEAMLEAARELRRIGLSLPEPSDARDALLVSAGDWTLAARLHGVIPRELLSA